LIISRKLLLRKLEQVAPAVAVDDLVPVRTHVCFTGEHLLAFNNKIGIGVPLQTTEFKGTLPGKTLTDVLKGARYATVVRLEAHRGWVQISLSGGEVELPAQPLEDFSCQMPALPRENYIKGSSREFFSAVAHCLASASRDCAVTLIFDGRRLSLCSINTITRSLAEIELPASTEPIEPFTLSADFCREMLALAKAAQVIRLAVHDSASVFVADDAVLFASLVRCGTDHERLKRYLPKGYREAMVPIRKRRLGPALKWAARICDIGGNKRPTLISIKDGEATFYSISPRGEVSLDGKSARPQ
jgi:DNA polymerase III sliding clamp (beta) subunit (PCNA family)